MPYNAAKIIAFNIVLCYKDVHLFLREFDLEHIPARVPPIAIVCSVGEMKTQCPMIETETEKVEVGWLLGVVENCFVQADGIKTQLYRKSISTDDEGNSI